MQQRPADEGTCRMVRAPSLASVLSRKFCNIPTHRYNAALAPDGGTENRVRMPDKDFSGLLLRSMALYFGEVQRSRHRTGFKTHAARRTDPIDPATAGGVGPSCWQPFVGGASGGARQDHPRVGSRQGQAGDCRASGDRAADGMAMGTALSGARDAGGAGGRAPVGTATRDPAREDRADRPQDDSGNAAGLHALEHTEPGRAGGSERLLHRPDLAGPRFEAVPGAYVQVEQ